MRFMPMLKNKFPAELRATSSATTIDVLKVWVWGDVMNVRSGVARGNGGIIFALFLLVLSSLEIARLESKGRQAGCRAYLIRNGSTRTVFVKTREALNGIYYPRSLRRQKEEPFPAFVVCSAVSVGLEEGGDQEWPPGCSQPGKLSKKFSPVQPNSFIPTSEE